MSCCVFRFVLFAVEEQNKETEKQEKTEEEKTEISKFSKACGKWG